MPDEQMEATNIGGAELIFLLACAPHILCETVVPRRGTDTATLESAE